MYKENAARHFAEAAQLRTEAVQKRAEIRAKLKPVLANFSSKHFMVKKSHFQLKLKINFFGNLLRIRKLNHLEILKPEGGGFYINNSAPFVRLSQTDKEAVSCTLTRFTIRDAKPLTDYLASPGCPLKRIIINNKTSPEVQQLCADAAMQRGGDLLVKVIGPSPKGSSSSSSSQT